MNFSICIPSHRFDQRFFNTLTLLKELDYPQDKVEVCIFLNGPRAREASKEIQNLSPFNPKICTTPQEVGPSTAKNEALKLASNDWMVLLDSDDFLVPSALNQYCEAIASNPRMEIGYEFSTLNFIDSALCYPPTEQDRDFFFKDQVTRIPLTGACGRPVVIKKDSFPNFDPRYRYAEERKLAVQYWKDGRHTHLLKTISYLYNLKAVSVDPESLDRIKLDLRFVRPLVIEAESTSHLTKEDLKFLHRAHALERLSL